VLSNKVLNRWYRELAAEAGVRRITSHGARHTAGSSYAVMGAEQASETLFAILQRAHPFEAKHQSGESPDELRRRVKEDYEAQADIRYGAARGWIDAIIQPHRTREVLIRTLRWVKREPPSHKFHTGVLQV
jgi:acetyl-CoA carboxylase carboxyltransferase component